MATVSVNVKMDEDVKKRMEEVCSELGLSMSAAFTIFAKKVGREWRIPFDVSVENPDFRMERRQPGAMKGRIKMKPGFDETPPGFEEYM